MDIKDKIKKYVGRHAICYLATSDKANDYMPEVRPISIMEKNGEFYLATSTKSRKAQEMLKHPKVGLLIPFSDGEHSGYLRLAGNVEIVKDIEERKKIAKHSRYNIERFWGEYDGPNLFFAQILLERVEFMNPGEHEAIDVTSEFVI